MNLLRWTDPVWRQPIEALAAIGRIPVQQDFAYDLRHRFDGRSTGRIRAIQLFRLAIDKGDFLPAKIVFVLVVTGHQFLDFLGFLIGKTHTGQHPVPLRGPFRFSDFAGSQNAEDIFRRCLTLQCLDRFRQRCR